MMIGTWSYCSKVKQKWTKTMTLFIIMFVMIVYLVVNEFTHRNVSGIFILMLLGQYTFFLTFSIVIDSMIPAEE